MTAEREYPREWFGVTSWASSPEARQFKRETDKVLFYDRDGKERRQAKEKSWERWFPTIDEALSWIDARDEKKDAAESAERIRDAAPDLLEALEKLLILCEMTVFSDQYPAHCELARAVIARARGESA